MQCIQCRQAKLEEKPAEMAGEVQAESYSVRCEAMVCPNCGYKTIGGSQLRLTVRSGPPFGRCPSASSTPRNNSPGVRYFSL